MSNRTGSTLTSQSSQDCIERLTEDPIIRELETEVPFGTDLEDWSFVRGALAEYRMRGGDTEQDGFVIGSPAAAIRRLREDRFGTMTVVSEPLTGFVPGERFRILDEGCTPMRGPLTLKSWKSRPDTEGWPVAIAETADGRTVELDGEIRVQRDGEIKDTGYGPETG